MGWLPPRGTRNLFGGVSGVLGACCSFAMIYIVDPDEDAGDVTSPSGGGMVEFC